MSASFPVAVKPHHLAVVFILQTITELWEEVSDWNGSDEKKKARGRKTRSWASLKFPWFFFPWRAPPQNVGQPGFYLSFCFSVDRLPNDCLALSTWIHNNTLKLKRGICPTLRAFSSQEALSTSPISSVTMVFFWHTFRRSLTLHHNITLPHYLGIVSSHIIPMKKTKGWCQVL